MSGDQPVAYTASEINQLLDGKAVVITPQDTIGQLFILPRAVGEVIFVGHGSPQGVDIGGTKVSWSTFVENDLMTLKSQSIYVAACYSENAANIVSNKYGNSKMVIGFNGLVDVDEAAYVVSSLVLYARGDSVKATGMLGELSNVMIGKIQTPERYNHWLLSSQWVRGIYHTSYGTPYYATYYRYTHPDWLYYGFNAQSSWSLDAHQNLVVSHISASVVSSVNLFSIIVIAVAGIPAAALLSSFASVAAAAVLAIAAIAESLFIEFVVRDELGSGWLWVQNSGSFWQGLFLYSIIDFKIGSFVWMRLMVQYLFGFIPTGAIAWPLGYGGLDLGIDGI